MEKHKTSLSLLCPDHDLAIGMLNINPDIKKIGYCYECIEEIHEDAEVLKALKSVSSYLKGCSSFYEKCRQRLRSAGEPPVEFTEELSKKGERLEKLSKHIDQEKQKVKKQFDEIRKDIMKTIDEKEKDVLQLLDKEVSSLSEAYVNLDKLLAKGWPRASDVNAIYPELDALKQRISKIETMDQLQVFMASVQEDIEREKVHGMVKDVKEVISKEISVLIRCLHIPESSLPQTESALSGLESIGKDFMKKFMKHEFIIDMSVELRIKMLACDSRIIREVQFETLRDFLPKGYSHVLKLLFRGSSDGFSSQKFHEKCDGQGATITLVKCKFNGVEEPRVIGGFLDQSWHSGNCYSISTEAFIFSLIEGGKSIKCPVTRANTAFYGSAEWGPKFGEDLQIEKTFKTGRVGNYAYANGNTLSPSIVLAFIVEDVEVYKISLESS